jgi:hypothetical protein
LESASLTKHFVLEAQRVVKSAQDKGITLRVLGAAAFRIQCQDSSALYDILGREVSDLDFVGFSEDAKKIGQLMKELGWEPLRFMSTGPGIFRDFYRDPKRNIQMDVFYDRLEMCHTIELRSRLNIEYPTIPIADLLLEKTQIVKINEKDMKDVVVLLGEHDVGEHDKETVNSRYIARVLSDDWGLYFTVTTNLAKVKNMMEKYTIPEDVKRTVASRIDLLVNTIEQEPKSFRWKMRARVGTRKKWYTDVEEVVR